MLLSLSCGRCCTSHSCRCLCSTEQPLSSEENLVLKELRGVLLLPTGRDSCSAFPLSPEDSKTAFFFVRKNEALFDLCLHERAPSSIVSSVLSLQLLPDAPEFDRVRSLLLHFDVIKSFAFREMTHEVSRFLTCFSLFCGIEQLTDFVQSRSFSLRLSPRCSLLGSPRTTTSSTLHLEGSSTSFNATCSSTRIIRL